MSNEKRHYKQKEERKGETFIFRMTEEDDHMLKYLSYRMDCSRSDVMRRALRTFFYTMKDQLD